MVDKIIQSGKLDWRILLVEDSLAVSGRPVLQALVNELGSSHDVHVFSFDFPISSKPIADSKGATYHDCFSQPRGWHLTEDHDVQNVIEHLTELVTKNLASDVGKPTVVVFDSLSTFLLHNDDRTYPVVNELTHSSTGVASKAICLLHEDVHVDSLIKTVEYLSTTVVKLAPPDKTLNRNQVICETVHRRSYGPIFKEKQMLAISSDYRIGNIAKCESKQSVPRPTGANKLDPTAGLTFKISLEETEKQARSNLILPYTKIKESASGQISYQPDDVDDFDEEDPDDDLNI